MFGISLNLLAAACLLAIPGSFHVADEEEKMLIAQFGEQYERYQRKRGNSDSDDLRLRGFDDG